MKFRELINSSRQYYLRQVIFNMSLYLILGVLIPIILSIFLLFQVDFLTQLKFVLLGIIAVSTFTSVFFSINSYISFVKINSVMDSVLETPIFQSAISSIDKDAKIYSIQSIRDDSLPVMIQNFYNTTCSVLKISLLRVPFISVNSYRYLVVMNNDYIVFIFPQEMKFVFAERNKLLNIIVSRNYISDDNICEWVFKFDYPELNRGVKTEKFRFCEGCKSNIYFIRDFLNINNQYSFEKVNKIEDEKDLSDMEIFKRWLLSD